MCPAEVFMEAFLVSTGLVALAEMGNKTQLLSLLLAARFRNPGPIVAGIFAATLANHALAGAIGAWVTNVIGAHTFNLVLGGSFVAMAVWLLIPDKISQEEARLGTQLDVFATTAIAFFLAEMGGKTQVATIMLAARFQTWAPVVAGTTLGMLLVNTPTVWFGDKLLQRIPVRLVQLIAAAIFFVLGAAVLLGIS